MLKPDAVFNDLDVNLLVHHISKKVKVTKVHSRRLNSYEADYLYSEHRGKHFYGDLVQHIVSGSVVLIEIEDPLAIKVGREIVNSIREEYAHKTIKHENVIHGSDSAESAERELRTIMYRSFHQMYGLEHMIPYKSRRIVNILNSIKLRWVEMEKKDILPFMSEELEDLLLPFEQ
jgi:nucleoside-diphosphate kinase